MLVLTANHRNRLRSDCHQLEIHPSARPLDEQHSRSTKTQIHRETINIGAYINRTLQPDLGRACNGISEGCRCYEEPQFATLFIL